MKTSLVDPSTVPTGARCPCGSLLKPEETWVTDDGRLFCDLCGDPSAFLTLLFENEDEDVEIPAGFQELATARGIRLVDAIEQALRDAMPGGGA